MADLFLIPYLRSMWRMLGYRLGPDGCMGLYGAGAHTKWLLSITEDLPPLPIECIIDDDPTESVLHGIPIRQPEEVNVEEIDIILLSSDRWEEEIAARCRSLWGPNSPATGRGVEIVRLYEGLPRGPHDKSDDRAEALRRITRRPRVRSVTPQQVVIVSDHPRSREAKLGYALKAVGWQPILLHRKSPMFDAHRYFDDVRRYNNEWEALRLACDDSPRVFHVMVNSDYRVAELFLRHRVGPVLIDSYDLIAGMYTDAFLASHPDFADEIGRERFCLEHADGLCCRSREVEFVDEVLGYRLPPRLLFPDGCWNGPVPTPVSRKKGEFHTAYAGHLPAGSGRRSAFSASASKIWLAQVLGEQRIHFHLYPWCELAGLSLDDALREYRELQDASPYFHLHDPVAPDRIVVELARYDLAMFVYNEMVQPEEIAWNFTPAKLRLCTSNKLFDFIDAGLPVVHTAMEGSFISSLLDKHGIRIEVGGLAPDRWPTLWGGLDLPMLRQRTVQARNDYDIRRHAHRLTDFYEQLSEVHQSPKGEVTALVEENGHEDRRSQDRSALV